MTDDTAVSHKDAAQQAIGHLNAAADLLTQVYEHPHHAARVENATTQIRNLASVIEAMPGQEASRADYAARLMDAHNSRKLHETFAGGSTNLPQHATDLLDQELARQG